MESLHACLQRVCIHTEATRLPMTALVTQLQLVFGALMMISVVIALHHDGPRSVFSGLCCTLAEPCGPTRLQSYLPSATRCSRSKAGYPCFTRFWKSCRLMGVVSFCFCMAVRTILTSCSTLYTACTASDYVSSNADNPCFTRLWKSCRLMGVDSSA